MATRARHVIVYGGDILKPPLLDSAEPQLVVFNDTEGSPMAFFARLPDNLWGLATRGDPDWAEMLVKYGLAGIHAGTKPQDVIADGVAPFITEG
jgi:hypothetical protein